MNDNSRDKTIQVLEKSGIPIVASLYAVAVAVQIGNAFDKLGWRIMSILILLLSMAWAVYVWTAKRPNIIDPGHLVQKYSRTVRVIAFGAVIISLVPAWFSILPIQPMVPPLLMRVHNTSSEPIQLSPFGEAFFSVLDSPLSERQVAATRTHLFSSKDNSSLVIPPKGEIGLIAQFLNEKELAPWLERGDVALRILITTTNGKIIQRDGIPFTKHSMLSGYYLLLEYK
jgi:hypothetical protein